MKTLFQTKDHNAMFFFYNSVNMQSVGNQTSIHSGFKGTSCACSISLAFPMLNAQHSYFFAFCKSMVTAI